MVAPSSVSLLLDDQLCFALYSATHRLQRLYRPLLDELDLTYAQYLVLLVLWEADGITVTELGTRLDLNSATLTPVLKRMEERGLVDRRRSTVDERRLDIRLTTAGRRLKRRVQTITNRVTCAAVEAADDAETLIEDLRALRDRLPPEV